MINTQEKPSKIVDTAQSGVEVRKARRWLSWPGKSRMPRAGVLSARGQAGQEWVIAGGDGSFATG
jgi:hypothetical protein